MSVTITILDPTSNVTRSIAGEVMASFVDNDVSANLDFYIQLTTGAKMVNGHAIPTRFIRSLSDLAEGTRQHAQNISTPYASLTAAIQDFVLAIVEGPVGQSDGEEMQF